MQELFQNLPGVIYEYSISEEGGRSFTYISENSIDILGLSAADLRTDSSLFRKILVEEDRASFEESLTESHGKEKVWNWEGRINVKGSVRWIETRSNPLPSSVGIKRKGIIIDITDRKLQEIKRESRYQSLVEKLPLGIGIHVNGEIVMANAYAHTILHVAPGELLGKNVMDFVHPDSKEIVRDRMNRVLAGENLPAIQEQFVTSEGDTVQVEVLAMPYMFKGVPSIQLIVRDITDQLRVQEEIRRNETLFTQLFNNIPMAVVMLDATGKVELVNKGFTSMFGFDLNELKGKNLNDFVVPAELQNEGMDLNNVISAQGIIQVETFRKRKNGERIDVILYGMPIVTDGKVLGIYGVYVDITSHRMMEEELKIRNAELDNFVYKVSHDLRAPLSSVLGLVNLAKLPGNTDDPFDYIRIIGEKITALDHFISDVLSHSKNLKLDVKYDKVDIRNILAKTIEDLNYLEGANDVDFNIEIGVEYFYSDPWRISEIFRNLVSNAIKYRNDQAQKPKVGIEITADDEWVKIRFSDNGIGISQQNLDRIFEMFYRATEQSDGSGIGLYIVKNAVDKLEGSIFVESEVSVGTTFYIDLPNRIGSAMRV
ncbi:MAG: PAS domain S-box protein [Cyclobacteriaceae bacterium]|nr:PAS domain S-box protein [Cyclobacteriaceae bacterium]UYN86707.1 MAG: PAS domain S-box protein [Cyclobacteriaceae bacterium]